jgi:hypothetical protein
MSNSKILKNYLTKCRANGLMEVTIVTVGTTLIPFIEWCGDKELKEFTPDYINDDLDFIHPIHISKLRRTLNTIHLTLLFSTLSASSLVFNLLFIWIKL